MNRHPADLRLQTAIDQFKAAHRGDEAFSDIVGALEKVSTDVGGFEAGQESPGRQSAVKATSDSDLTKLASTLAQAKAPAKPAADQPNQFEEAAAKAAEALTAMAAGPGSQSGDTAPSA